MDLQKSEFWNYSSQIWTLPNSRTACLELQNSYEADINILLYCCWIGNKKLKINDDDLQVLLDTIQPWQIMIKPLRDARKMMQQQTIAMPVSLQDQTIKHITEMELNAEHMSQIALERAIKISEIAACNSTSEVECSLENLKIYLNSLENINDVDELTPQIGQLLTSIFQDEESVQTALMSNA